MNADESEFYQERIQESVVRIGHQFYATGVYKGVNTPTLIDSERDQLFLWWVPIPVETPRRGVSTIAAFIFIACQAFILGWHLSNPLSWDNELICRTNPKSKIQNPKSDDSRKS